jgi:hypothetical protein
MRKLPIIIIITIYLHTTWYSYQQMIAHYSYQQMIAHFPNHANPTPPGLG